MILKNGFLRKILILNDNNICKAQPTVLVKQHHSVSSLDQEVSLFLAPQ